MRIGIIGAGAVGGLFAARLAESGADVAVVARGETLERIKREGLALIHGGEELTVQVPAAESFDELGGVDVAVLATKVLPGQEKFPGVPEGVPVALTQNSVEVPHLAADAFGAGHVWPGVVRGFMIHRGPGVVELADGPLNYHVGTFDGEPDERVDELARLLTDAGIPAKVYPDIWVDVWTKAMFVTPFGALGAAAERPLGYVRSELRDQYTALLEEAARVAWASGVDLPDDAVARQLGFADSLDAEATTSMQRDYLAGRVNELDSQAGAVRRLGERYKEPTPLFDQLQGVLEARFGRD